MMKKNDGYIWTDFLLINQGFLSKKTLKIIWLNHYDTEKYKNKFGEILNIIFIYNYNKLEKIKEKDLELLLNSIKIYKENIKKILKK